MNTARYSCALHARRWSMNNMEWMILLELYDTSG
jgi:hypothetical protein